MKNLFLSIFISLSILPIIGQTAKGYCKIKKTARAKQEINDSCLVRLNFFNPNKEPAKSHIKFTINNDTVFPTLTSDGTYSLYLSADKYKFTFFGTSWYDVATNTLKLRKDSITNIKVYFEAKEMKMPQVTYDLGKPILYFYPTKPTEVEVKLNFDGEIFFSYPSYSNGWKFLANPNGKLEINNQKVNYIFWEGIKEMESLKTNWNEGFIVDSDSLVNFFEKNLSLLKLNSQEIEDLITFWVPKMKVHSKNFIHFLFNEEYDQLASLQINPKPDNLIRFFMVWSPLKAKFEVSPQKFPIFSRNGFTVVDWGGTEIKKIQNSVP